MLFYRAVVLGFLPSALFPIFSLLLGFESEGFFPVDWFFKEFVYLSPSRFTYTMHSAVVPHFKFIYSILPRSRHLPCFRRITQYRVYVALHYPQSQPNIHFLIYYYTFQTIKCAPSHDLFSSSFSLRLCQHLLQYTLNNGMSYFLQSLIYENPY